MRTSSGSSPSSSSRFCRRSASAHRPRPPSHVEAPFASWSLRTERPRAALVALAATAVFAAVWAALHYGFYADNHIVDTPVYQRYGDAMVKGQVPYDDFSVEYPPAALPAFAVPSLVVSTDGSEAAYDRVFGFLMAICGAAAIAL